MVVAVVITMAVILVNTRVAKVAKVASEESSQASTKPTSARIPAKECTLPSETRDTETRSQLCKEMSRDRRISRLSKIAPTNGKLKEGDATVVVATAVIVKMTSLSTDTTLAHQSTPLSVRANKSKYLIF